MTPDKEEIAALIKLVRMAGGAAMAFYGPDPEITIKEDKTPVTDADRASHEIILSGLNKHFPGIPVVSEEGEIPPRAARATWNLFWLVDPLDGTKEFINRNGEFTVNVALIEGARPVFGIVSAPALGVTYMGGPVRGSCKITGETGEPIAARVSRRDAKTGLTVVKSRSHPSEKLEAYLAGKNITGQMDVGSSLKFCMVAEGRADLYARFGPTMEWDTAAGHAVLLGAGGRVITPGGYPLAYNKEDLRNGPFIADNGLADGQPLAVP